MRDRRVLETQREGSGTQQGRQNYMNVDSPFDCLASNQQFTCFYSLVKLASLGKQHKLGD